MILKYLHIILLASVKYMLTLPYAMLIGLNYKQALFAVLIGGIGGVFFFYYLSKRIIVWGNVLWPFLCKMSPPVLQAKYQHLCEQRSKKITKKFTRKNRFLARFKKSYGLWGIVITTPLFLTIPLGTFLANKYYSRNRFIVLYMILSIVGWTGIISGLLHLFPKIFF
jgi:hypothetical protein